jgi:hypothetical protein
MSVLYRFCGQAGYNVDTGRLKKIRIEFGMIDQPKRWMAWYEFISDGVKKSKRELANPDPMPPEQFGYQIPGGRDIPHTFKKQIGLEELAIDPKGTPATLTLEVTGDVQRFRTVECRLLNLKTKAKEVVNFPFGIQQAGISVPARKSPIHGKVRLVTLALFDAHKFPKGPQGPMANFLGIPG